jgi:DNA repair protein RadC
VVKGPADVSDYLLREFGPSPEEKVILLILDQSNRILDAPLLEEGIENRANVYIKKAVRVVLDQGGTGVILVHNHPSGQPEFSRQDVQLTSALAKAFKPLEIRLLDHFLIAMDQVVSMKDEGIGFD